MSVETLSFKIGISGTFHNKRPAYSVLIDDKKVAEGTILGATNEIEYIEFSSELTEETKHTLVIRLENKDSTDTIQNEDKTAIVKDMLLNINSIEVDEIDLGSLLWTASVFTPDDGQFPVTKQCVNMGWNGAYTIEFESPFYLWLLENM